MDILDIALAILMTTPVLIVIGFFILEIIDKFKN